MIVNVAKAVLKNLINVVGYPSFITFFVTWACNARCTFCDVWKKRCNDKDSMSPKEIEDVFAQMKTIDVLRISGGEPFLRKDIAEIINRIDKVSTLGLIHITTNGLLTAPIISAMKEVEPIEKIHIKVSIDNIGEKHDKIRGVKGAYERAMRTVQKLSELRKTRGFHIGVNQAIVEEAEIGSYFALKEILKPYDVPVYPSIAVDSSNSLYSNIGIVDPTLSFKTFGKFSEEGSEKLLKILVEDGKKMQNLQEQIVDRYHLMGLYNRLVKEKNKPNPKCVALNNHLRILPNGDVPICLYNGEIVGNLRQQNLKDLWFGDDLKKEREWVRRCSGCWQSCESAVSAIYTGDIWKGLFY